MTEFTRRDALRVAAAGAAGASVAVAATSRDAGARAVLPMTAAGPWRPGADHVARIQSAQERYGRNLALPVGALRTEAMVLSCRSWDRQIYLYRDEDLRGFAPVDECALALAAACQVAERPVAVLCWGYEPAWGDGVGRFGGVLLALDPADLPRVSS